MDELFDKFVALFDSFGEAVRIWERISSPQDPSLLWHVRVEPANSDALSLDITHGATAEGDSWQISAGGVVDFTTFGQRSDEQAEATIVAIVTRGAGAYRYGRGKRVIVIIGDHRRLADEWNRLYPGRQILEPLRQWAPWAPSVRTEMHGLIAPLELDELPSEWFFQSYQGNSSLN